MSSKNEPDIMDKAHARPRRTMSIALRMTLWYAFSTFALISVATGLLYWVLVSSMYQEDVRDLADNLNNARLLLSGSPPGQLLQSKDQRPTWAPQQQPQIYLRVLDADARTVVETPGMSDELPAPTKAQLAAIGTLDDQRRDVVSQSGKPFLMLVERVSGASAGVAPRFVQVAMDRAHADQFLARYRERLWLVLGLSLILCSLAGYLIARSGMRPIERIGRTAERIGSTTLHERIEMLGLPEELSGLADTFNTMLDRLQESFARISRFSDDVAHELRTPINNLRGEVEVTLSKARSGDDYREILGSCLEECERISRIIQSLLFLARTESSFEPLQREQVDVSRELLAVQEFYEAAAAEAGIDLSVSAAGNLWSPLDRTLFQQAVGNLVSNAIAHTPKHGTVVVGANADDAWLQVSVADSGCGIAPEHLPHVLDRFYRVDRSRSGSPHNVGLGLAVVKSIVERHVGTIEIHSERGIGTQVKMLFPR